LGRFPAGGEAEVNLAVTAARRAFNGAWRKISPSHRGRLLQKAAALIEKHGDELAQLIVLENGKPLWEAKKEVGTAASWTEYYAGWTTKLLGDTIPVSLPGQFLNYTTREPLGVVAGITPPNYPLTMPLYKAVPRWRRATRLSSSLPRTRRSWRFAWGRFFWKRDCRKACSTS
jgi:phenylacetaldehyde dehydrogenase